MPFSAPYKRGSGSKVDEGTVAERFERYGVLELERQLARLNYLSVDRVDGKFGWFTHWAVRRFQKDYTLVADGIVGESTLGMLFGPTVDDREEVHNLPYRLLHAIVMKESRYDPGAYYQNENSLDRGIAMLNSNAYPDLFDPSAVHVSEALDIAAVRLSEAYGTYTGKGPKRRLSCTIASYNSPLGAHMWFRSGASAATPKLQDYVAHVKSLMVS